MQQQTARGSLSQPAYLILTSLRYGPKHMVALREAIEQSEGLLFEPATLHRFMVSLERRGWIEALTTGELLRTYCITALGLLALEQVEASQKEQQWVGERRGWLRVRENIVRLAIWMLCLYPSGWRERYEAEMAALLRQHEVTLWTLLDLLMGAFSVHLDRQYRRGGQALPLQQLRISWRLLASAGVAFWFTSLFWLSVPGGPWILGIIGFLASVSFPCFLFAYVVWIVCQVGENMWNLLRLLPLALCTMLFLHSLGNDDHVPLLIIVAFLTLVAESGGAMLTPEKRWIEENCNGLLLPDSLRFMGLPALLVTIGMAFLCVATIPTYLDGHVKLVMLFTTMIALFALVYGFLALKAIRSVTPKR
jgi:DNA-binding PadR family transcriptional regulator